MTVIITGGGSGGHITPILAVATEIKKLKPETKIIYIGQRGDKFADIAGKSESVDQLFLIRAGKFRRFHGEGVKQIFNLPVMIKNLRDLFYVAIGIVQSSLIIRRLKPAVVFSRGGYVSVPVALGAHFNHVPYITHDSDPIPSLANRIIAPWAEFNAVALPKDIYPYPKHKTITTGIPLNKNFAPVDSKIKAKFRQKIGVPGNAKMLFVIGGGLGSQTLNDAVIESVPSLLAQFKDLYVYHVAGEVNEAKVSNQYKQKLSKMNQGRVKVFGYTDDVYAFSGAADVIISRAGATNLAEFALQGKACIVVPSYFLTGGHQIKNADYLAKSDSAIVVQEDRLASLGEVSASLLEDAKTQAKLAENLSHLGINDAAEKIAKLTFEVGHKYEAKA